MGLSNISFGMPQRPYLNVFLAMATCMSVSLTTPIMNHSILQQKAFVSSTTLLGWDPGSAEFIKNTAMKMKLPLLVTLLLRPDKNPSIVMIL